MKNKFNNFTYESKYGTYDGCFFEINRYVTMNSVRVDVTSRREGPITTVTVNIPEVPLEFNQCILNSLVTETDINCLKKLGVIKDIIGDVPSGFTRFNVAEWTPEFVDYINSKL